MCLAPSLFAFSCVSVTQIWGFAGLVLGLLLAGGGVVPVALLAALFHSEWSVLFALVLGIALTFGTRFFGLWLMAAQAAKEDAGRDYMEAA